MILLVRVVVVDWVRMEVYPHQLDSIPGSAIWFGAEWFGLFPCCCC